jgi:hypothetical protein
VQSVHRVLTISRSAGVSSSPQGLPGMGGRPSNYRDDRLVPLRKVDEITGKKLDVVCVRPSPPLGMNPGTATLRWPSLYNLALEITPVEHANAVQASGRYITRASGKFVYVFSRVIANEIVQICSNSCSTGLSSSTFRFLSCVEPMHV